MKSLSHNLGAILRFRGSDKSNVHMGFLASATQIMELIDIDGICNICLTDISRKHPLTNRIPSNDDWNVAEFAPSGWKLEDNKNRIIEAYEEFHGSKYNKIHNNCQHFAYKAVHGYRKSPNVDAIPKWLVDLGIADIFAGASEASSASSAALVREYASDAKVFIQSLQKVASIAVSISNSTGLSKNFNGVIGSASTLLNIIKSNPINIEKEDLNENQSDYLESPITTNNSNVVNTPTSAKNKNVSVSKRTRKRGDISSYKKPNVQQVDKNVSPQAIADLLNLQLQPKGIKAKVSVKNSSFLIILEAINNLSQPELVNFIRQLIVDLEVDTWHTVTIYGRKIGEDFPDWHENITIDRKPALRLEELAKQGDVKAISTLLCQHLPEEFLTKFSIKDDCLQVMLESPEAPDQHQMELLLKTEVVKLEIQSVKRLRIYAKQSGEDFPDWHSDIKLAIMEELVSNPLAIEEKISIKCSRCNKVNFITKYADSIKCSRCGYFISAATR